MGFKGAASALLVVLLAGVVLGVLIKDEIDERVQPPAEPEGCSSEESTGLVGQMRALIRMLEALRADVAAIVELLERLKQTRDRFEDQGGRLEDGWKAYYQAKAELAEKERQVERWWTWAAVTLAAAAATTLVHGVIIVARLTGSTQAAPLRR